MQVYHLTKAEIELRRAKVGIPTPEEIAKARRTNEEFTLFQQDCRGVKPARPLWEECHIPTLADKLLRVAEHRAGQPQTREDFGKWDLRARVAHLRREKLSIVDPWD